MTLSFRATKNVVAVILMAGFCGVVLMTLRTSEPCVEAFRIASEAPEVQGVLGTPIELGWVVSGHVGHDEDDPEYRAALQLPVSGPKGRAELEVRAVRAPNGVWVYERISLKTGTWSWLTVPIPPDRSQRVMR